MAMEGTVRDLWARHSGRTAIILGGGPSLPEEYARCPSGAVRISVNSHGLRLDKDCEYVVFLDPWVFPSIKDYGAKKITYHRGAYVDYHFVLQSDVWCPGFSAATAAWIAAYMDCDPIILVGMDCFTNPEHTYWHTEEHVASSGYNWPVKNHQNSWRRAYVEMPRADRVRAMGGPLLEVFPPYEQDAVHASDAAAAS